MMQANVVQIGEGATVREQIDLSKHALAIEILIGSTTYSIREANGKLAISIDGNLNVMPCASNKIELVEEDYHKED